MAINFYCLDLETNGTMVGHHAICELSIIRATDKMQLTQQVRIDKVENSSIDALKIIGKSMNDLKVGISDYQVIDEVETFLAEDGGKETHRCLVGHNIVSFDRRFLWHLWEKYNRRFPFDLYLDTMQMFREYAKRSGATKPKVNLAIACETMGVQKTGAAHTAKYDTRHTFLLWQKLNNSIDYLKHIKQMPHIINEEH